MRMRSKEPREKSDSKRKAGAHAHTTARGAGSDVATKQHLLCYTTSTLLCNSNTNSRMPALVPLRGVTAQRTVLGLESASAAVRRGRCGASGCGLISINSCPLKRAAGSSQPKLVLAAG
jgi:hypothetical protein